MSKVTVNGKDSWEFEQSATKLLIDGVTNDAVVESISDTQLMVKPSGGARQFVIDIIEVDHEAKKAMLSIGSSRYEVDLKSELDQLLEKMGMGAGAGALQRKVKAPMPGLVIDVMVTPGQEVQKDEPILILEAMKMENVIKAPRDGAIKAVGVEKGAAIEKNALLIEFES
ncbi:MAG: acetyl-CoA carboxylase biotin carboxyl carrier protein subunit [Flavobacteriales bacterium]|nr:acetyl-CoA carboxylase biotin carboxyl carrier protein subunit [Flavobacteriales bacterium]